MALQLPPVLHEMIRLSGGMDLVTPTLSLPPGFARDSLNFEALVQGGYARIQGYERFDGRASPSAASFGSAIVTLTGAIAVGNTITGAFSGATGVVIYVNGADIAYTKETGTFQVGESLLVGGNPQGAIAQLGLSNLTAQLSAQLRALAANVYRADITVVPGSGPVRGVASLAGIVYAWRDDAAATQCVIHRATASGWAAVNLGRRLQFSGGVSEIAAESFVNGQTSGATGIVKRVALRSGSWSGSAAGYLFFETVTGAFINGENIRVGTTVKAVTVGVDAAQTIQPGGTYEFYNANFGGPAGRERIYGCDSVNPGFEFDGTIYAPIFTGMALDQPNHVVAHKNHLFFAFGSSVQHSGIGNPFTWTPVLGAAELGVVGPVTNFRPLSGAQDTGALAIFSRNALSVLYGTSSANWNLVNYQDSTGALEGTAQSVTSTYVLDDRGVMSIANTQSFGNFDSASLTQHIQPWLEERQSSVQCSTVNRRKSQYRLFFGDGSALYMTFRNTKLVGAMPMAFPNVMVCVTEAEVNGLQEIYCGSDNGFVYRFDVGTSFDGVIISATLPLVFNSSRSPRVIKRYRKAAFEMTGNGFAEFSVTFLLGYGSDRIHQPITRQYEVPFSTTFWDEFTWDDFVWDGLNLLPAEIELEGSAENISIQIASEGDLYESYTLNAILLHYTPRRGMR